MDLSRPACLLLKIARIRVKHELDSLHTGRNVMAAAQSTTSSQLKSQPKQRAGGQPEQQAPPKSPRNQLLRVNLPAMEKATLEQRAEAVLRAAQEVFSKTDSWVIAFRLLMGRDGAARQAFADAESYEWFATSAQCADLQEMIAAMRSQDTSKSSAVESERMITIRLPSSLHDTLTDEADAAGLSVNKLCISKLVQPISSRFVPIPQGERRGRRPGPQGSR